MKKSPIFDRSMIPGAVVAAVLASGLISACNEKSAPSSTPSSSSLSAQQKAAAKKTPVTVTPAVVASKTPVAKAKPEVKLTGSATVAALADHFLGAPIIENEKLSQTDSVGEGKIKFHKAKDGSIIIDVIPGYGLKTVTKDQSNTLANKYSEKGFAQFEQTYGFMLLSKNEGGMGLKAIDAMDDAQLVNELNDGNGNRNLRMQALWSEVVNTPKGKRAILSHHWLLTYKNYKEETPVVQFVISQSKIMADKKNPAMTLTRDQLVAALKSDEAKAKAANTVSTAPVAKPHS